MDIKASMLRQSSRLCIAGVLSILAFFGMSLLPVTASAAVFFSEGFESVHFNQWTQVDTGSLGLWKVDTARFEGRYSARVVGPNGKTDDILRKSFATDGYANPELSFMYKASSLDAKSNGEFDQFFVEYSVDGVTWVLLKEVNGKSKSELDGSWRKGGYAIPADAGFQFRFRAHLSDSGDRVWVDNVVVTGVRYENSQSSCTDGVDNDEDGSYDKSDADCASFYKTLSVSVEQNGSGVVTSNPVGIACGFDCTEKYLNGFIVILKQVAATGFRFLGWGGDCEGMSDCAVTMETDKSVVAQYESVPKYSLTVINTAPTIGSVQSVAAGISCGLDCEEVFYEGTQVTLTASATSGYRLKSWEGACTGTEGCTLNITADATVTASFEPIPFYTLTVENDAPEQGTILSLSSGINCGIDCTDSKRAGTTMVLVATPKIGFDFNGWGGDCTHATGNRCTITYTKNLHAIAHYVPKAAGQCGDSVVSWDEQCDDGGLTDGDGCSATCGAEAGFSCSGQPSQCIADPCFFGFCGVGW